MNDQMDAVATMLSHFVCADAGENLSHSRYLTRGVGMSYDAGCVLRFDPLQPTIAVTAEIGGDRLFATDPRLLLNPPQDIIGHKAEIALVTAEVIKWTAFRRVLKRPRGVWVANPRADLYEVHSRFIRQDGSSDYVKRIAAIDKRGNPVRAIIEGTKDQGVAPDGELLVMAASIIEDSARPGVFTATVMDSVGVTFPVPDGEHLDVFRLRDGPNKGGRRRPLLHWVAQHIRRTAKVESTVREHLRGIHQFSIDGFDVTLQGADA